MGKVVDKRLDSEMTRIEIIAIVTATIPHTKFVDEITLPDGNVVLRFQNHTFQPFDVAKHLSLKELGQFLYRYIVELGISHGRQLQQQDFRMVIGIESLVAAGITSKV